MQLESMTDDEQAGFRLHRFELYNWGTFDKTVWHISPNGENTLLTGDIGSGKSTVVDALTTLLVPAQQITYNKAAGAESKERNLESYVRGHYKSGKEAEDLTSKPVPLRDKNNYSVLLGYFYNHSYDSKVTLAQVFSCKEDKAQPERFYIVSTNELTIEHDFSHFGSDISDLKKRLKRLDHVEIFDSFSSYSADFRRHLGIDSEQALTLFYQTVSMKSVGNLTEFVRNKMLEQPPVQERVESICREFDDLNRAHKAILKAKSQLELLHPLFVDYHAHQQFQKIHVEKEQCRESVDAYFAHHKIELLTQRISQREIDLTKHRQKLLRQQQDISDLRDHRDQLKQSIEDNGGRRLETLATEISRLQGQQQQKGHQAKRYQAFCAAIDLAPAHDSDSFLDNRQHTQKLLTEIEPQQTNLTQEKMVMTIQRNKTEEMVKQLDDELTSLRARRSNIPLSNLQMREQLCAAIGVSIDSVPFIGELLNVDETQPEWEGAIERVLHNFGLSLLVAEEHYEKVAHYVDSHRLKGRIVYFRIKECVAEKFELPAPQSLFHKLRIQTNSSFYDWLRHEIALRFDYFCANNLDEFRRQPKAITQQGQIKSGANRHEKDDRYSINDRSKFILGWDNHAKIESLGQQQAALVQEGFTCIQKLKSIDLQHKSLENRRDKARDLLNVEAFDEIDWQSFTRKIDDLLSEKKHIEQDSDILKHLQNELERCAEELRDKEFKLETATTDKGRFETNLESDKNALQNSLNVFESVDAERRKIIFPKLRALQPLALPNVTLTIATCENNLSVMRNWLGVQIASETGKLNRLHEKIIRQMQTYKDSFKAETRDVDVSLESTSEFAEMLEKLESEDLPRHEKRFHQMLKEGTIQKIAMFQANLDKEQQAIRDNTGRINRSLSAIDYNTGTYITLVCEQHNDGEIRTFQQDLRACLADALSSEENLYDERRFHQVKKIIDRFQGQEGSVDADKKWTKKVTDVRNWFVFSASERWREDDQEKEYYSDSAGKSGGQKEKLAYTILASALAYQFGLEWGETKSRSFRFVMIDEAFGRGSDDSARYGLELFKKLNLQLLIVTPLQKINIIENYVKSVNLVHNEEGKKSMLRNLTIHEYHQKKPANGA
ncbi:MAG: ATP-binding protein [Methylococcaceae bacterium]